MKGLQRLSLLPVGAEEGKTHEHTHYIYIHFTLSNCKRDAVNQIQFSSG